MPTELPGYILLFLFLSLCRFFCAFVFFFCSHWSLVDVPLIFFCPADHVPDWQPRVLLGMVEARLVNVKKTTTTTTYGVPIKCQSLFSSLACGREEVPRSTGHIVVTTRYSDQQGSKSRQKVMRLYKQWRRPMSKKRFIKIPRYAISRATWIDSDCCRNPRPAFSATKRTNYYAGCMVNTYLQQTVYYGNMAANPALVVS